MELNFSLIAMNLLGGLALFLFGMDMMSDALKIMAGDGLKSVLKKLTVNRFAAAGMGALVTAIIQSSSVTTVLVVGFINAGLMSLEQSIGIIMGANIGSTITAQVIAFKVTHYALGLFFVGWFPLFFVRKEKIRQLCSIVMGLGLIFLGMSLMSDATKPLRDYQPFIDAMKDMDSPLYGVFIGALFTAIVQSSAATTGVVIMLASHGVLSLPGGIAIVMGANIGTCITAALASIGKRREAVQAVAVHVFFNVIGVALWMFFIPQLAHWMVVVSPQFDHLSGVEKWSAESPRQIANAHTFFNVLNTLMLIGFTTPIARWVKWLIPSKPISADVGVPRFLNRDCLETPALALDLSIKEMDRLIGLSIELLKEGDVLSFDQGHQVERAEFFEEGTDALHREILSYLSALSLKTLTAEQSEQVFHLMSLANNIESFGDTISDNILKLAADLRRKNLTISSGTQEHLRNLYDLIQESMGKVQLSLQTGSASHAQWVINQKAEASQRAEVISHRLADRLRADEPHRLETYRLETDLNEMLKRLYYLTKCCAKGSVKICKPSR